MLTGPAPGDVYRPTAGGWAHAEADAGAAGRRSSRSAVRPTGDFLDGREHCRFVQLSVGVEAEERVDILLGHLGEHLRAGLVVGLSLIADLAAENLAEDADPVHGTKRLRAGHGVFAALVLR